MIDPDHVFGNSVLGSEIYAEKIGTGKLAVLLIGGVHGDESEGYLMAERFLIEIHNGSITLPEDISLYICPRLNPDGCANNRRTNQHNVDLNRNLPTRDWDRNFSNIKYYPGKSPGSEPETAATVRMIEQIDPALIVSLHSYEKPMINFNGDCEDLAISMSEKNGLPPKGDIGYPTPGSLGTYGGWERNLPVITLEILRGQNPDQVWKIHRDALLTAFSFYISRKIPERRTAHV